MGPELRPLPVEPEVRLADGLCAHSASGRLVGPVLVADGAVGDGVDDVHAFPGHIACDSASSSELVVPLVDRGGNLVGVFDLDSPRHARFDADDQAGLEALAAAFMQTLP